MIGPLVLHVGTTGGRLRALMREIRQVSFDQPSGTVRAWNKHRWQADVVPSSIGDSAT
ncbi:MAG: hypothetical protein U0166_02615 [Acidobacteriota bacterium]